MKSRKITGTRFVVCVNNVEYPASLELHKLYPWISDPDAEQDGDIRIIDESGEDYIYPAEHFVVIDASSEATRALSKSFAQKSRHVRG